MATTERARAATEVVRDLTAQPGRTAASTAEDVEQRTGARLAINDGFEALAAGHARRGLPVAGAPDDTSTAAHRGNGRARGRRGPRLGGASRSAVHVEGGGPVVLTVSGGPDRFQFDVRDRDEDRGHEARDPEATAAAEARLILGGQGTLLPVRDTLGREAALAGVLTFAEDGGRARAVAGEAVEWGASGQRGGRQRAPVPGRRPALHPGRRAGSDSGCRPERAGAPPAHGAMTPSPAELERHSQAAGRAIAQACAGAEVTEAHPATGEPLTAAFLPDEVVAGASTQRGLHRVRLKR